MKNLLLLALIAASTFFFTKTLRAQTVPTIQLNKTFGGNAQDWLADIQQTTDGGYILGGYSISAANGIKSQGSKGGDDYWIIKLDSSYNKQWDRTFGGSNNDKLNVIKQTSDGGYIVGGYSTSNISGDKSQISNGLEDIWIIKLDSNGQKQWDKTFGGSNIDYLADLQETSNGYIIGGTSYSGINGDKSQASRGGPDYWIIKLDANGIKIWDKTFGTSATDIFFALQETPDKGYILGGFTTGGISGDKSQLSKGGNDYWIIKVDSSGQKLWDKSIGGASDETLTGIEQTNDGGFALGGFSYSGISGDKSEINKGASDYWIVKLNSNGIKQWDKTIGGNNVDNMYSIQQCKDHGYILVGNSNSDISGDKTENNIKVNLPWSDAWVVKLNSIGVKEWGKTLGGTDDDGSFAVRQTRDNGFIVRALSRSNISGVKTEPSYGSYDYWIVKLAGNVLGIKETETAFPVYIYPNPGNGKFNFQLSNLKVPAVEVTVSDMLGRKVLQQELQVSGQQVSRELTIQTKKGIYLLQIKAGDRISTRKIVVE